MKYLLVSLIIFSCLSASAQIENIPSFIQAKYGDKLKSTDLDDIGGAVIGNLGNGTLTIGQYQYGTTRYLVLEVLKGNGAAPVAHDVLKIQPGINQVIVYQICRSNKQTNSKIIALVNYEDDAEYFTDVISAWVANEQTMTLDEIAITGIDCENIEFGI